MNTCAACHAGGQNIVASEKTLEKEALEEYLAGGFNEAAIVTQVRPGGRGGGGGRARFFAPVLTAPPRAWAPVLKAQGASPSRGGPGAGRRRAPRPTPPPPHF